MKKIIKPLFNCLDRSKRLFPSYLFCLMPFLIFGSKSDVRLMLWKVAVVGAGLIVFHFVRKSMFPYIDLQRSFEAVLKGDTDADRFSLSLIALAQSFVISALALSIIFAMASGI